MDKVQILIAIENKIEEYYITLANMEVAGFTHELEEYQRILKLLKIELAKEEEIIKSLKTNEILNIRNFVLKRANKNRTCFALGSLVNVIYDRLLALLNNLLDEDLFEYETNLRYDINQIIQAFLNFLISNPASEDIRGDLIFFKYNKLFLNYLSENDFIFSDGSSISEIKLESSKYKTKDFLSKIFVDKTVLILEGYELLDTLSMLDEDFRNNNNRYAQAVISLIEVLARLILCDQDLLPILNANFTGLMESETTPEALKELMQDMYTILNNIKDSINWAR